jgi:filamentous hemagglutinin family protein
MKKTLLAALLAGATAWALPENGQVVQGQIQMNQPNANVLQILQASPTGIINWGSFSIGPQQLVQFLQSGSGSATLNRVIGQEPSQILGQLQANGRILLINPNGILFGPGSVVDTGSFLASTLALQDGDFLAGRYDLHWDGVSPLRAIVNQGEIRVAEGGFLALVSPLLDNQGVLVAERGQVVLGATRQATLTVDAGGLLQVAIPDGFRGTTSTTPGTVLLSPGQMSDTLAQLVTHYAGSEAGTIVDTGHGIELRASEGLLVQQGTVRADAVQGNAGTILLNSSQATVLAPGSLTSATSQNGNGGDIRVLSADYARQQGVVQASSLAGGNGGFVEVSAPHVAMTRGADVSATSGTAGVFLVDPDNIFIRVGGTDPANQPFGVPGSGDIEVDPSALNVPGTVTLEANQSIVFDPNVQVGLDFDTDLVLRALQAIVMNPGSAIHAVDSGASVTMDAVTSVDITEMNIATAYIRAGDFVRFNGGGLGRSGQVSLVNVSAPSISFADGTVTQMRGSEVNFNTQSSNDFLVGDNARLELQATTSSNLTVSASGIGFNPGSALLATGSANSLNFEATSGVFNMAPGSGISSGSVGSVLNVTATQNIDLRDVLVPTVQADAGTFARFNGGQVGSFQQTNVNVTAADISFAPGSTTDFLGSDVNVTLTADVGVGLDDGARWNLQGTNSNKAILTSGSGPVYLNSNAVLSGAGPTELIFHAGTFFQNAAGSTIEATSLAIDSPGFVDLRGDLRVSRLDAAAGTYARFLGATVGRVGLDTLVNVTASDEVALFAGTTLEVLGDRVEVNFRSDGSSVFLGDGSLLQLSGQTSNLLNVRSDNDLLYIGENTQIQSGPSSQLNFASAGNTVLQRNGGSIQTSGPGNVSMVAGLNVITQETSNISASRLDAVAGNNAQLNGNEQVSTVNASATNNLEILGNWGRAGSTTRIDGTGANVTIFNTTVQGSQVNWNLAASSGALVVAAGRTVSVEGSGNGLNWSAARNVELGSDSTVTAQGATQLSVQAGERFLQSSGSAVRLNNSGSNFDLATGLSPALNRIEVGGRLSVTASGGNNIRIADQLVANQVILSSPGQLLDDRNDNLPAIVANQSLNVTVANISGPLSDPNLGLVQAMPFATGPNAQVRFQLSGPNNTTLGNRSANLYYVYPQSGDVRIDHPNSDVALYYEPGPPAPRGIQTRDDLSPQAFQEVTAQSAQAQVQLSSLYSVADLPASDNVLLLEYDNAGLTQAYSINYMTSALVERIVLSPEQAVQARRSREKQGLERPANLLVSNDDEDEQTLYWRRLIEGILIWEE